MSKIEDFLNEGRKLREAAKAVAAGGSTAPWVEWFTWAADNHERLERLVRILTEEVELMSQELDRLGVPNPGLAAAEERFSQEDL